MQIEKRIKNSIRYTDLADKRTVVDLVHKVFLDLGFTGVSFELDISVHTGKIDIKPLNLQTAVILGEDGNYKKECLNELEYNDNNEVVYRYINGVCCKLLLLKTNVTLKIEEEE